MIQRLWASIRTYFTHRITTAVAEALNAKIQSAKRRPCGCRNLRIAIYFHWQARPLTRRACGQAHDVSHTILGRAIS